VLSRFVKQSWLVMVSALVFGLLVAAVHGQLKDRTEENKRLKLQRQLQALLRAAQSFETVTNDAGETLYYLGKDGSGKVVGYGLVASGSGFADKIELLIAFDGELRTLRGIAVLKSNETPGFGDKIRDKSKDGQTSFKDQFVGCPIEKKLTVEKTGDRDVADEKIVAISGATISSEAVTTIVNKAIVTIKSVR